LIASADLDPDAARTGSIGAVNLLRHDALGAKLTGVREDNSAVLGNVFIEQDARLGIAQQPRQRCLAVEERAIAHVLAVMLDEVEGVEDCGSSALPMGQLLEP
jgi:hypothetical protein